MTTPAEAAAALPPLSDGEAAQVAQLAKILDDRRRADPKQEGGEAA